MKLQQHFIYQDFVELDNYDKKNKQQQTLNTSSNLSSFDNLSAQYETKKKWKKKNTSDANTNTLSLHIAAIEADGFGSVDGKNAAALKRNKIILKKYLLFHGLFVQNPFDFPRQKEEEEDHPKTESEVMGFKASQRLLGSENQSTSSNTVQISTTAIAGSPARMPNIFVPNNFGPIQDRHHQQLFGLQPGLPVGFNLKKNVVLIKYFKINKKFIFFKFKCKELMHG
uniref:Uncharacterized protein n=1 Tax=Panagrolaimus davidi TaxID=227884 RepID=A0A914P652_9BILA